MLNTVTLFDWLRFSVAVVLFIGPGYALVSLLPERQRWDRTQTIIVSIGLAIAAWAILLAWLQAIQVVLSPLGATMIFVLGWGIGLARLRPWQRTTRGDLHFDGQRAALWLIAIVVAIIGICSLRDLALGPGSDIYHHTLITTMIRDRGLLPEGYQPYAPLVTFTYHFGFHGMAAAISWLSGFSPVVVVPVVAQVLTAVGALTVAFLAEIATRQRSAGVISALLAGLICVFPAYFINWGRFTQLTGLVLLPILLGVVWQWSESQLNWRSVPFIGILAAGLVLAHYRVALMAAMGVVTLLSVAGLAQRWPWKAWLRIGFRLMITGLLAGLYVAPWGLHVLVSTQRGYPIDVGQLAPIFLTLDRLEPNVRNYPTNWLIVGLTVIAVTVGGLRRERVVIGLTLWSMVMLVAARDIGKYMDPLSVFISLYIPVSVIVGWFVAGTIRWMADRWPNAWWAWRAGLALLGIGGAFLLSHVVEPNYVYATSADLQAMAWIRANTPPKAHFLVNSFKIYSSDNYVTGSDAGYWLPLLGERSANVPPMIYPSEHAATSDFLEQMMALSNLGGQLTAPQAIAVLHREGITHVYVGEHGGSIVAADLLNSPYFKAVYQNDSAYVFELTASPALP